MPLGRPLRVLMVTGAYHPEISASAVQCRDMARQLAGRAEIHVLTTAVDPALPNDAVVEGVNVSRVRVDVSSGVSRLRAGARMLAVLCHLIPRCDVVHLHGVSNKNLLVTAVAKIVGRPVVLSLHTAGFDEAAVIKRRGALTWWAFRRADLYLTVSPGLLDAYLGAGLPPDRVQLVPNGIDTTRFAPANTEDRCALRERLGLSKDRPVILFVGFFSRDKQPRVLFDAWSRLRDQHRLDTTLTFVGATQSPYFEVDEDLVAAMRADAVSAGVGDRVIFTGPTDAVHDYLRAADLFVLPSRREGLPVALLEAMACGLPCVASRLPGSTDMIVDEGVNGVLVAAGDVVGFARAFAQVLSDDALSAALGTAARLTIVRRFSSVDVATNWLSAYHLVTHRS